jgi:hypothetical protein
MDLNEQIEQFQEMIGTLDAERDREISAITQSYAVQKKDLSRNLAKLETQRRKNFLGDYLRAAAEDLGKDDEIYAVPKFTHTVFHQTMPCDPILGLGDVYNLSLEFQHYVQGSHAASYNKGIGKVPYGTGPKFILWAVQEDGKAYHRLLRSLEYDPQTMTTNDYKHLIEQAISEISKDPFTRIPGSWKPYTGPRLV